MKTNANKLPVFYDPTSHRMIDGVKYLDPRRPVGVYSGDTWPQLRREYPGLQILPADEAQALIDESCRRPPWEISEERYWDLLNCLPPLKWIRHEYSESFMVCEAMSQNTHTICCWRDCCVSYFALMPPCSFSCSCLPPTRRLPDTPSSFIRRFRPRFVSFWR